MKTIIFSCSIIHVVYSMLKTSTPGCSFVQRLQPATPSLEDRKVEGVLSQQQHLHAHVVLVAQFATLAFCNKLQLSCAVRESTAYKLLRTATLEACAQELFETHQGTSAVSVKHLVSYIIAACNYRNFIGKPV